MFALKCALFLCAVVSVTPLELGNLDVIFHLFTRANPQMSQPLLPTFDSLLASSFSLQRKTVITIHSYGQGVGGNFNAFVIPVHLESEDVNVIAVDWSPGSGMYVQGLGNAPQCGERIAQFINLLVGTFQYDANNFRIVGVGLGAHIAGIAAREAQGAIPHIFALDPSLFGWPHNPYILNADDAGVVEVLHTTAGLYGYDYPLGDIDFYANGGSHQNGCFGETPCSHTLSYAYYAESVRQAVDGGNRFVGTHCESYEEAIENACEGDRNAIFGGIDEKEVTSGIYHFTTNFVSPFARD